MIFYLQIISKVTLKSWTQDDKEVRVQVTANNGVAASWGIHRYLKYFCKVHISWDVDQLGEFWNYRFIRYLWLWHHRLSNIHICSSIGLSKLCKKLAAVLCSKCGRCIVVFRWRVVWQYLDYGDDLAWVVHGD